MFDKSDPLQLVLTCSNLSFKWKKSWKSEQIQINIENAFLLSTTVKLCFEVMVRSILVILQLLLQNCVTGDDEYVNRMHNPVIQSGKKTLQVQDTSKHAKI